MDYYQNDESFNPLFANTEYLLSSMINWIYFFASISRDGIMSDDVRSGNTMCTKDGILILDLDLFKKYNGSNIDKLNLINFVRLCDEVIAESLMGTGEEFASYKFINYNNLTIEDITKKLLELEKI